MAGHSGYLSDMTYEEWAFVLPHLLLCCEDSPQRKYDLLTVYNAVRYVARTGGQWRFLPHYLPPWYVVYVTPSSITFLAICSRLRTVSRAFW